MPTDINFMDEKQYAAYRRQIFELMAQHSSPEVARNLEAMGLEFLEHSGRGCYIYDVRGRRYFDAATGGGVFALGHAHPSVVEAVCAQARLGALSARVGIVPSNLQLLHRLSALVPGNPQYGHIGSTGTEAVEAALKLARLTTGRPHFVGMEYGYHGMSIATVSVSGVPTSAFPTWMSDAHKIPFNDIEAARRVIDESVAAVILEPIQWAAGCRAADIEYLRQLRQICTERGALLILDEIQTGLGRTGAWFYSERAGIVPDMTIIGKALSGGVMPISAVMYGEEIHRAEAAQPLYINSTFAGNPLACAAALAALDYLERPEVLPRINAVSRRLEEKLEDLQRRFPHIVTGHSGMGLMRCLVTSSPAVGFLLSLILQFEQGVCMPALTYDQRTLRISPPYIAADEDLDFLFGAWDAACERLTALGPDGLPRFMQSLMSKKA